MLTVLIAACARVTCPPKNSFLPLLKPNEALRIANLKAQSIYVGSIHEWIDRSPFIGELK
jgi:hypothetical protein